MALRLTAGPEVPRSAKPGDAVTVTMKVENKGQAPARVSLFVEDLKEGALGRPLEFPFVFDPPAAEVPARGRAKLAFAWKAALPEGKPAHTFRGRLVVKETDTGALVAHAPLDLYVGGG